MLSKETILNYLPKCALKDKRYLPKEQGIYILIIDNEIIYVGASKNIYQRLASGFGDANHVISYFHNLAREYYTKYAEEILYENARSKAYEEFEALLRSLGYYYQLIVKTYCLLKEV